jgi:putative AbiEii toxin of type IV toxin-antitoxin system
MRFEHLHISNFRGISAFEVGDLTSMVVVAGPNGCGKSSVFDAVRLLKSAYGGYQQDEWQIWFGEFQINLSRPDQLRRVFRDPAKPVEIVASLSLAESEVRYLREKAAELLEPLAWQEVLGRGFDVRSYGSPALATELRVHGPRVRQIVDAATEELAEELASQPFEAKLVITPTLEPQVESNRVLEIVFQTFDPHHVGIIDYHGPMRVYQREVLGGLNLNLEDLEQRRRQQSLYNWQSKYSNVKSELAATYVRELIAKDAGAPFESSADLNKTLSELFQTFFSDKTYSGPRPTSEGAPEFPVTLATGEVHDIDDLSSGEKELLYGYLRLRASAPQNSVVLLDEPELHLNPALLQGLPDFYHRHLGRALGNQLWLVTHSDAILRQAVGNRNFAVFHMRLATATPAGENQALVVQAEDELERAIIDLVGDLATYKPHAKVVILEGSEGEFDRLMVSRLFPSLAHRVNLVSGGSRRRVHDLYEILAKASAAAGLADRFFAVVDRDAPRSDPPAEARSLVWDRYHIENYLLEPPYICAALGALRLDPSPGSESEIAVALEGCARSTVKRLVLEELQAETNQELISAINIGAPRDSTDPARDLKPSIQGSADRLSDAISRLLDDDHLASRARAFEEELEEALASGNWISRFPGRLILSRFVGEHVTGVSYEHFRNLVVDQMVDDAFEPIGMKRLVDAIDAA